MIYSEARIAGLLETGDRAEIERLFLEADDTRRVFVGDEVHLRGIINFSNHCRKNCLYCGLRRDNVFLRRYRMDMSEIFDTTCKAASLGCRTVVLQSGEDPFYTIEDLCHLVRRIKGELDLAVTLSVGELCFMEYEKLRQAGADRYLLKFETSDPVLYRKLRPDSVYRERFEALKMLRELGYQVGSGIMTGLPGQSPESMARDILLFSGLGLDMVGNGPFIPHPGTPLKAAGGGDIFTALKVVALTRLVTLDTNIPATTALEATHTHARREALGCGANVIMPDMTPRKYGEHYYIYPGRAFLKGRSPDRVADIRRMLASLGRPVAENHGHRFTCRPPLEGDMSPGNTPQPQKHP